jgi:competence protein ComEC
VKKVWQNLEHYLLIASTLSFLAGIILHHLFPATLGTSTFFSGVFFIPVLLAVKNDFRKSSLVLLLFLICSLGFFRAASHSGIPEQKNHINNQITEETDVVLSGTLDSMPLFDGEKTTILLNSRAMRTKKKKLFTPVSGMVQLRLQGVLPATLKLGTELLIRCKLSRPYRFGNLGGFDYPAFLAAQNIYITGHISSIAHVHILQFEKSWLRTIRYIPENLRMTIRDFIDQTLTPSQAGIYKALLIGDRSGIDKRRLEAFKTSGTMHILAISGLHISLVATALFLLFYWLTRRSEYLLLRFSCKKLALLATIPPICFYTLLTGTQTPVLRSVIVVIVFILACCVQRQRSPFNFPLLQWHLLFSYCLIFRLL